MVASTPGLIRVMERLESTAGLTDVWLILNGGWITLMLLSLKIREFRIIALFFFLLKRSTHLHKVGRPFKFFNYMVEHGDFDTILSSVWAHDSYGTMMKQEWRKLQVLKDIFKHLH